MDVVAGEAFPAVNRHQASTALASKAVFERVQQGILTVIADELEVGEEVEPVFRPVALCEMLERCTRVRRAFEAVLDCLIPQQLAAILHPGAEFTPGATAGTVCKLATLARDLVQIG